MRDGSGRLAGVGGVVRDSGAGGLIASLAGAVLSRADSRRLVASVALALRGGDTRRGVRAPAGLSAAGIAAALGVSDTAVRDDWHRADVQALAAALRVAVGAVGLDPAPDLDLADDADLATGGASPDPFADDDAGRVLASLLADLDRAE